MLIKAGMAVALIPALGGKALAQITQIPPSNPDISWYNSFNPACSTVTPYIAGINTAMIDFNTGAGIGTLIVSDYFGNNMAGGIVFRDEASGFQVQMPYGCGFSYIALSPDIIVGNKSNAVTTQYIVAAAYISPGLIPQIDYYNVTYITPTSFIVTPIGSTLFNNFNSNSIHLDIVAEAGNTSATGYPWCDTFIVTWDSWTSLCGPPCSQVFAYKTSLNAPVPLITPVTPGIATFGPGGLGYLPDVAAVQRQACHTCPIEDWALVTYMDYTQANLYYQEWNTNTLTPLPPVPEFSISVSNGYINYPRIDAPDDYTINALPGKSFYKIVAEIHNSSTGIGVSSYTFDNIIGAGFFEDDGFYLPVDPYSPTVAFGGNNDSEYQVSHYGDEYTGGGPGSPAVYMEAIDWTTPAVIPALCPTPLLQPYFLVNSTVINPALYWINGNYLNATSTPCNNPSEQTLVAWAAYAYPPFNYSDVWYKTTHYGPPNGYAFRQSAPTNAVAPVVAQQWQVYPNPATTSLTINSPLADAGRYEVADMLGRTVTQGALQTGVQTIDINSLIPGSYIINMYDDGIRTYNTVFVKQ